MFYFFPGDLIQGQHLFPFRTEKLRPESPMILCGQLHGKVGFAGFFLKPLLPEVTAFFIKIYIVSFLYLI